MATTTEVLEFLIPDGGWAHTGEGFEGIQFLECEPITKKEFEAGFAACDAKKVQQETEKAAAKTAVYAKLGLTVEEVAALLA